MTMSNWSTAAAKARLSELLARASESPQVIERRGKRVAVVVAAPLFDELSAAAALSGRSPMETFLERTAELKKQGDLALRLPRRRTTVPRPSPFQE
jgi:prevent-host-death family protein